MNAKQIRQTRLAASRSLSFTFGPYAVTCTIRNPETQQIVGYGIGHDQPTAIVKALDSLRPLA